jgi:pimeloyl-ACP methyl ester carboxylesterase
MRNLLNRLPFPRRSMLIGLASVTTILSGAATVYSRADRGVRRLRLDGSGTYYLCAPLSIAPTMPLFVAVHGISRNAEEHAQAFAPLAEKLGVIVLAPLFDERHYADYQRLGRTGLGARADLALLRMIKAVREDLDLVGRRVFLYGHSGGAQFVHRFAMAHPEQVSGLALSAAGWYTWPDPALVYPLGIGKPSDLADVAFDPRRFLAIPACIYVGAEDVSREGSFNHSARLDQLEGTTRLERARRWAAAMTAASRAFGHDTAYTVHEIGGANHDFTTMVNHGLPALVFNCLFSAAHHDT